MLFRSYRLKAEEVEMIRPRLNAPGEWQPIGTEVPGLAGEFFLVTGSGKYFRNLAVDPEACLAIIELDDNCLLYTSADPTVSVKETLKGKLPQKKLVRGAAHGSSSYGNQIGLATGYVKEICHPNNVAKRMEIGAVMGAAPRRAVIRENSDPGDIIILLGGRTGRDGIVGAACSSKVHTEASDVYKRQMRARSISRSLLLSSTSGIRFCLWDAKN